MSNTRIKLDMNVMDMLMAMAGENPGAITVCIQLLEQEKDIDGDSFLPVASILNMDTLGIYEHRIWMLYKNVCSENLVNMIGVLRANQLGFLSTDSLNKAIDGKQSIDVQDMLEKVRKRLPQFGMIDTKGEKTSS